MSSPGERPEGGPEVVPERSRALADTFIQGWLRRFRAVSDRSLRRTVLRNFLEEIDDQSLLAVLARLEDRAACGELDCRWLLTELALTPSVLRELPYGRLTHLYEAATVARLPRIAARFLGYTVVEKKPGENPHLDSSPGERTAAAKGYDRLKLDRLLHDRDPRVIAVLLDNPRLVERDVIRIAAMHPTLAVILESIASHPRWGQRYVVRKALAFNPSSPPPLARQVLGTLLKQDLRDLLVALPKGSVLRGDIEEITLGRAAAIRNQAG